MGDLVQLHEDPHDRVQKLLPWYANGTLDPAEAALVEEHLMICADCRAALETDIILGRQTAAVQLDPGQGWEQGRVEQGWAAMRERLDAVPDRPAAPLRFLRRPVAIGWAIAAQAIAAALILVLALPSHAPTESPTYHALGATPAGDAGNIIVMFGPDTTQRAMRGALDRVKARLVGGPTATGAYIVTVPGAKRLDALKQLRAASGVVLAEPIDQSDRS